LKLNAQTLQLGKLKYSDEAVAVPSPGSGYSIIPTASIFQILGCISVLQIPEKIAKMKKLVKP
jgi:hypothetical protein